MITHDFGRLGPRCLSPSLPPCGRYIQAPIAQNTLRYTLPCWCIELQIALRKSVRLQAYPGILKVLEVAELLRGTFWDLPVDGRFYQFGL